MLSRQEESTRRNLVNVHSMTGPARSLYRTAFSVVWQDRLRGLVKHLPIGWDVLMQYSQNEDIVNSVFENQTDRLIILIWLGTCDLTRKTGKFLMLKNNPSARINVLSELYETIKSELLASKPNCTVLILPCPDYSLVEWNKSKGHSNPQISVISWSTKNTSDC